jgi:Ca2+-binding RTX toxin-like protein
MSYLIPYKKVLNHQQSKVVVSVAVLLLSLSLLLFAGAEQRSVLPVKQLVWASSSHNNNHDTPPLANGMPGKSLCVTCPSDKNILRGEGLIVGTNHPDYIIGSTLNDIIFGKNSDDIVFADLGVDTIYGGNGDDSVQAGPGNDQILGEDGDDNLFGGFDDDLISGGDGNDHLFGDIGNDVLIGGPGSDYFDCGDGIDEVLDFNPAQGDVIQGNCEIF